MKFLKAVFSESSEWSFGRIAGGLALLASIIWITYLVWKTHVLPDLYRPMVFGTSWYGVTATKGALLKIFGEKTIDSGAEK